MLFREFEVERHSSIENTENYNYSILVGNQIWEDSLTEYILKNGYRKVALVIDVNVYQLYKDGLMRVVSKLSMTNINSFSFKVEAGESSKSLIIFDEIVNCLKNHEFSRKDLIVAIGGGVVGDLVGFVAATYMRGIALVQMPTTLLSQMDSSIGGKVAINYKLTKNLLGTFYNPKLVIIDISFLRTISFRLFFEGITEGLKAAFLKGDISKYTSDWFTQLMESHEDLLLDKQVSFFGYESEMADLICDAIHYKRHIVQADPFENGIRVYLNFGHTVGHALESYGEGQWLHGEAIAMGMVLELFIGEQLEISKPEVTRHLIKMLKFCGLSCNLKNETVKAEKLLPYLVLDKKNSDDYIGIVILEEIGKPRVVKVNRADFVGFLNHAIDRLNNSLN